jgi:hypothetical protein
MDPLPELYTRCAWKIFRWPALQKPENNILQNECLAEEIQGGHCSHQDLKQGFNPARVLRVWPWVGSTSAAVFDIRPGFLLQEVRCNYSCFI